MISQKYENWPALSYKKTGDKIWNSINYKEYYETCKNFGKGLISLGVTPMRAVNIIGFNHPAWNIAFFGSIFAQYMPVGVYTTNGPEAC